MAVTKSGDDSRNELKIYVGEVKLKAVLNSGAEMSAIPSRYVAEANYTGENVELTDFEGLVDRTRKVAVVLIKVGLVFSVFRLVMIGLSLWLRLNG